MAVVIKSAVSLVSTMTAAALLTLAAAGSAQADVVDLSLHGANVFALNDFKAPSAAVQGSILAGRDVQLSNYSVNNKNLDAYGSYALIVGRDLSFTSGSIKNGNTYVGGTSNVTQSVDVYSKIQTGAANAPANLGALATQLKSTSSTLAKLNTTGTASVQWSALNIKGSKSAVEVIDIDAETLAGVRSFNFSNLSAGATLIMNISGKVGDFNGGYSGFEKYNVLFNFYQATDLGIHTGLTANILAPLATVSGGSGTINGNVVVDNWISSVSITADHYFKPTNVKGFMAPVPEPETYAMLLAGLGMIGFIARRRQRAAAR